MLLAAAVPLSSRSPPLQESLKSRVDGSSSDAASDAGSLGGETERELAPSSSAPCPDSDATPPFSWRGLLSFCGSGLLMSVAYLVSGNALPGAAADTCSRLAARQLVRRRTHLGLIIWFAAAV